MECFIPTVAIFKYANLKYKLFTVLELWNFSNLATLHVLYIFAHTVKDMTSLYSLIKWLFKKIGIIKLFIKKLNLNFVLVKVHFSVLVHYSVVRKLYIYIDL